jgi:flagellar biosynthesis chaperone FliJ
MVVVLLGTAGLLLQLYRKSESDGRQAQSRIASERVKYERAIAAIGEIRDSLLAVAGGRSLLEPQAERPAAQGRTVEQRTRETLARIAWLGERIRRNQATIAKLQADAQSDGAQTAERARAIALLRRSVAREQQRVAGFKEQLQAMTTRVATLETEVRQNATTIRARETTIEAKRRELATIFYVVGTKRELAAERVVYADGGHFGLGRSLRVAGHPSDSLFTALDTDRDSVIRIPALRAEVLSAQDAGSYVWTQRDGALTLEIVAPQQFRKVKYLVIRTD